MGKVLHFTSPTYILSDFYPITLSSISVTGIYNDSSLITMCADNLRGIVRFFYVFTVFLGYFPFNVTEDDELMFPTDDYSTMDVTTSDPMLMGFPVEGDPDTLMSINVSMQCSQKVCSFVCSY